MLFIPKDTNLGTRIKDAKRRKTFDESDIVESSVFIGLPRPNPLEPLLTKNTQYTITLSEHFAPKI